MSSICFVHFTWFSPPDGEVSQTTSPPPCAFASVRPLRLPLQTLSGPLSKPLFLPFLLSEVVRTLLKVDSVFQTQRVWKTMVKMAKSGEGVRSFGTCGRSPSFYLLWKTLIFKCWFNSQNPADHVPTRVREGRIREEIGKRWGKVRYRVSGVGDVRTVFRTRGGNEAEIKKSAPELSLYTTYRLWA